MENYRNVKGNAQSDTKNQGNSIDALTDALTEAARIRLNEIRFSRVQIGKERIEILKEELKRATKTEILRQLKVERQKINLLERELDLVQESTAIYMRLASQA